MLEIKHKINIHFHIVSVTESEPGNKHRLGIIMIG